MGPEAPIRNLVLVEAKQKRNQEADPQDFKSLDEDHF
jgi:hypothetical protein